MPPAGGNLVPLAGLVPEGRLRGRCGLSAGSEPVPYRASACLPLSASIFQVPPACVTGAPPEEEKATAALRRRK
jgi:hypothetical protein